MTPIFLFLSLLLLQIYAECPNACSGHGRCGQYDSCSCYRNWMDGDCSSRVCQFGLGHVDTPIGDLDGSLSITDPDTTVVLRSDLYPKGTAEVFPNMIDSDGGLLSETGHAYRECSGKGWCNRMEGICECQVGYTGSACQFLDCPRSDQGVCSGHGVCESISTIAARDHGNVYNLWDEHSTLSCMCDPGFTSYDCGERQCKQGYDPLYIDNVDQSHRYSNWSYVIYHTNENATVYGNYSLIFYDVEDTKWETRTIPFNASCGTVIRALERLPGDVLPSGSVRCVRWPDFHGISPADEPFLATVNGANSFFGIKYTLAFPRNPGLLRELDINIHTQYGSKVPTLYTDEPQMEINPTPMSLGWFIYANGFSGEFDDHVHDRCENVDVTIATQSGPGNVQYQYLTGLTNYETRLLKRCLGDVDGKLNKYSQKVNVQGQTVDFDFGTVTNPHFVKLVDLSSPPLTDMCGKANEDGLRDHSQTRLCRYGFATSQDSEDFPHTRKIEDQMDRADIIPNVATFPDKPYFGPDMSTRPPGFFAALIFDSATSRFKLFTKPGEDYSSTTTFRIFTTKGTAIASSLGVKVFSGPNNVPKNPRLKQVGEGLYSNSLYTANITSSFSRYNGDISCENTPSGEKGVLNCIEKNAMVFVVDPTFTTQAYKANPKYLNLYRVDKISGVMDLPDVVPGVGQPTIQPTVQPTKRPTAAPTRQPTATPSLSPTEQPTVVPSATPTTYPTVAGSNYTDQPTEAPTVAPSPSPTFVKNPSSAPVTTQAEVLTTPYRSRIQLNMGMNAYYQMADNTKAVMYTFYPHVESTYNYVAECSSRGACDTTISSRSGGVCDCHVGYHLDDCSYQYNPNTLASPTTTAV